MSQSVEIPMALRIFVTVAFALILSSECTRTSGLAAAAGFDDLPDDQKEAALELLNNAMLETNADPIKLIKMGLDKAKEKANLVNQDSQQDAVLPGLSPTNGEAASTNGNSMISSEMPVAASLGSFSSFPGIEKHDDDVSPSIGSEPEPTLNSEPKSILTADKEEEDKVEPESEPSEPSAHKLKSSFDPTAVPDSPISVATLSEPLETLSDLAEPRESVQSSSVYSQSGSEHHSETSDLSNHEDYEEVHVSSETSSDSSHHEEVHLTKGEAPEPLHHVDHGEVHVSTSFSGSPSENHHEEVRISTSGSPSENHHEEVHISTSGPGVQERSHEEGHAPSPAHFGSSGLPYVKDAPAPTEEKVFEDAYIDRSDPSNPSKVHIQKKQKTSVAPDGYTHENHESKTTISLDNPNNYRHQESSSSSHSSGSKNKHRNRNKSSYKQRRPYPMMPAMRQFPSMPRMPAIPPMPPMTLMPYGLHPTASAWTGLYGASYDDPLGYASSGAFASAYAGIPSEYYGGYPNYGAQSKRNARRRKRKNQARRARYQQYPY